MRNSSVSIRLDEHVVKATSAPTKGAVSIWDDEITGLGLRLFAPTRRHPVGARLFSIDYRASGVAPTHASPTGRRPLALRRGTCASESTAAKTAPARRAWRDADSSQPRRRYADRLHTVSERACLNPLAF